MKAKHFFLALFLTVSSLGYAQDKYEFMIISAFPSQMTISIDGKVIKVEEFTKEDKKVSNWSSSDPMLKKASEMQEENWEIMSFNEVAAGQYGSMVYFAHLRRKKK